MNIIEKSIKELIPYENNPRKNEAAVPYVAKSIRRYGFKVPIIIDKDGVIVAGHTRYLAAIEIGLDAVPCIVADDLSDEQIKEFRLVDNKTAEFADWDFAMLDEELQALTFDAEEFGFDFDALEFNEDAVTGERDSMAEKYLVPPFSVLYANKPKWLERKRQWVDMGIRSEIGRGGQLAYNARSNPAANFHNGGGRAEAFKNNTRLKAIMQMLTPMG